MILVHGLKSHWQWWRNNFFMFMNISEPVLFTTTVIRVVTLDCISQFLRVLRDIMVTSYSCDWPILRTLLWSSVIMEVFPTEMTVVTTKMILSVSDACPFSVLSCKQTQTVYLIYPSNGQCRKNIVSLSWYFFCFQHKYYGLGNTSICTPRQPVTW